MSALSNISDTILIIIPPLYLSLIHIFLYKNKKELRKAIVFEPAEEMNIYMKEEDIPDVDVYKRQLYYRICHRNYKSL